MSIDLDALRAIADNARAVADPIRTTTVVVRTRTWPSGRVGKRPPDPTTSDLTLPVRYKVRELTDRERRDSGGKYEEGDVRVGPITPPYVGSGGGGYSADQLAPAGSDSVDVVYVLSGAIEGVYKRVSLETDRPFRYIMVLRRTRETP